MKIKLFILFLLCILINTPTFASQPYHLTQSSKVSLLTCTPNDDAIYTLFGHSALRVKDDSLNLDMVFDYGIFDFDADNFIWRFMKGETDYKVAARSFNQFLASYSYRSVGVSEQVFDMSINEKRKIFEALIKNILPENRIYRYNFFYDNCSTRPRDIVVDNLETNLVFTPYTDQQTYRDLLHECLILTPWSRFGINLVIGSDADKVITERQKDFLPTYLANAFSMAHRDNTPLVASTSHIIDAGGGSLQLLDAKKNGIEAVNQPLILGVLLLMISILVSYLHYSKRKNTQAKLFDSLLFLIVGIAGSIIFFLSFFSEHPCVDANWNLVWLNPLPFLFVPFFFVKSFTKYVIFYHFVNFVLLILFIVCFAFIPQKLEVAFIPYILTICLRSACNLLVYKKYK